MRTEKEKMLAGELYDPLTPELVQVRSCSPPPGVSGATRCSFLLWRRAADRGSCWPLPGRTSISRKAT